MGEVGGIGGAPTGMPRRALERQECLRILGELGINAEPEKNGGIRLLDEQIKILAEQKNAELNIKFMETIKNIANQEGTLTGYQLSDFLKALKALQAQNTQKK